MFVIKLLPPTDRGGDGERLGEITIGKFREIFGCYPRRGQPVRGMDARWRAQLRRLVTGERSAVSLVKGASAWIVYRVGKRCYIRERYFLPGTPRTILPRRPPHHEEGTSPSEWRTTVTEVERFLKQI